MEQTTPDKEGNLLSIRQITRRNLLVLLGVLGLLMSLLFGALRAYLLEQNRLDQQIHVRHQAENIGHAIGIYRDVVAQIAHQPKLADFIQFSMGDEAYEWARRMRTLLPGSIGLGLFEGNGQLLGNPMRLRLGKMCVADMNHYLSGENLPGPRVHRGAEGMEHFDVVAPVHTFGETAGVVFASFSLDTIQRTLDRITVPGQSLLLTSYDGTVIARTDRLEDAEKALDYELPVPDTGWRLHARMQTPALGPIVLYLGGAFGALALAMATLFALLSRTLSRAFTMEMTSLRELIQALYRGTRVPDHRPRLRETGEIFFGIRKLAKEIASYQQSLQHRSNTDDLTGLANRRALRDGFPEILKAVEAGERICLVLIDMDHFKPVNDCYGHAVGDEVLRSLADCLKAHTYPQDLCARLGGDEFVVVLRNFDPERLEKWFRRILADFHASLTGLGLPEANRCTLSAGAVVVESATTDLGSLLSRADNALYEAKQAGRASLRLAGSGSEGYHARP